jgi:hypothetical protein
VRLLPALPPVAVPVPGGVPLVHEGEEPVGAGAPRLETRAAGQVHPEVWVDVVAGEDQLFQAVDEDHGAPRVAGDRAHEDAAPAEHEHVTVPDGADPDALWPGAGALGAACAPDHGAADKGPAHKRIDGPAVVRARVIIAEAPGPADVVGVPVRHGGQNRFVCEALRTGAQIAGPAGRVDQQRRVAALEQVAVGHACLVDAPGVRRDFLHRVKAVHRIAHAGCSS